MTGYDRRKPSDMKNLLKDLCKCTDSITRQNSDEKYFLNDVTLFILVTEYEFKSVFLYKIQEPI